MDETNEGLETTEKNEQTKQEEKDNSGVIPEQGGATASEVSEPVKNKVLNEAPLPEDEVEETDKQAAEEVNSQPIIISEFETGHVTADEVLDASAIVVPKGTAGCDDALTTATSTNDLTFQLEVQDGWVAPVTVTYRIQKEDGPVEDDGTKYEADWAPVSPDSDGNYTIARNGDNGLKGTEKKKCFTGPIEIRVTAAKNTADLIVDASVTSGVYFVQNDENGDLIAAGDTKSGISFEEFTKEITLLVKAEADETVTMEVTGQTASDMTRGADVDVEGDEEKWTQFTIDPKTLAGYDDIATTADGSFTVELVTDNPDFTYDVDNVAGKYTLAVADLNTAKIPTSETYSYFTLTAGSPATAPTAVTRRTYLKTGDKTNVLVFEVAAAANTEVTGAKAELALDSDSTKVLQTIDADEKTYADGSGTYYAIDLSGVDSELITDNVTLTLKADTVYVSEAEKYAVHKITLAGDLDNVEIKNDITGASFDGATALDTSFDTDAGELLFGVRAKDGYAIANGTDYNASSITSDVPAVTVSYTKQYELTSTASGGPKVYDVKSTERESKELRLELVADGVYKLEASQGTLVDGSSQLLLVDGAGDKDWAELPGVDPADYTEGVSSSVTAAPYSLKDIIITINTTTETNQSGKFNVVSDKLDYTVVTGSGVEQGDTADSYTISEDAEFVILNVTAPGGAPTVKYVGTSGDVTIDEGMMVKNGDVYQVKIPVTDLHGADKTNHGVNSNIDSTITIAEGKYTFEVHNVDASPAVFTGQIKVGEEGEKKDYDDSVTASENVITRGETVPVVLYAVTGTEFKTVKVVTTTGDNVKTEEITLGDDKTTVELNLAMTGNVDVQFTTNPIYDVELTRGGVPLEKGEDGVYVIPFGAKNIDAKLLKGTDPQPIAYARLYDDNQEAATTVTLVDTDSDVSSIKETARIASVSDKDTGVLRLDLAAKVGNKITVVVSLQMRQERTASVMSITNPEDGSVVTDYTAAPDTAAVKYDVKAVEGNLTFTDSSVLMELAKDASKVSAVAAKDGMDDNGNPAKVIDNSDVEIVYTPQKGTLSVTAKPTVEGNKSYVLRFYDKAKRDEAAKNNAADRICAVEGGTLNITITPPAVKSANFTAEALDATNTTLRIQVSSDEIALDETNGNSVFYRVTLGSQDKVGAAGKDENGNPETIAKETRYYQWTDKTQILEYKVNPTKTAKDEDFSDPQTFHPTVELVQTTAGNANAANKVENETEAKKQGNSNKLAKSDAIALETATKEARYEHELTLSPAKATVYLGQKAAVATTAQFSDTTGFAEVSGLEFINTKTGARRSSAGRTTNYDGIVATIGDNGEVKISATSADCSDLKNHPEWFKDLGLKVSAKTSDASQPASAILSVSVIAGVSTISFENGYYQNIYKQPGKSATLKIKAVLNEGVKESAPKKKKLVYAIGDAYGNLPGDKEYKAPSAQVLSNVTVNANNGTVTVKKDFTVDAKKAENNKFSVVATEIYSNQKDHVTITVTETAQSVSRVVIVDSFGKVVAANGVLKADDFYSGDLYVRALTSKAGTKRKYSPIDLDHDINDDYMTGVKYTSNSKSNLAVDATSGKLTLLKMKNKPIKLTVASADGSKDKGVSVEVTLQGFSAVGLNINGSAAGVDNTNKYENAALTYDGAVNSLFDLRPMVKVNGQWTRAKDNYFKNWTIKVQKAKTVKLAKTETKWRIVKTDGTATVTITDKTDKSATMTYTIAQNPQADAKAKAPKIKALTKLTQEMVDSARNAEFYDKGGKIALKFQITGKESYAQKSVMITPDYSKNGLVNKIAGTEEYIRANRIFFNWENSEIVKVNADNTFEMSLDMWHRTDSDVIPGNYTLIATVGTYKNGKFVPDAKGASIKIKIPGKAPKTLSMKLDGGYDLDESGAPVELNRGISSGYAWELEGSGVNYAKNVIDPDTGKANKFTTFFEVLRTGRKDNRGNTVYTLGFKGGNKAEDIAKLRENQKDCQGYVTVQAADGQRQDMLITVNLVDSEIGYSTKDSYKGAEATVQFYTNGSSEPISIAGVSIDKQASQGTPSFVVTSGSHVKDDEKSLKIKLGSAEKGNSYDVTFKVLAKDSAYAKASDKPGTMTDAYVEKYGRTVTATFNVVDPAQTQGAVWFEPVDEEIGLAFTAFSTATYDKTKNIYSLDIRQESAIDGAVISVAKVGATTEGGSALGTGIFNIKKKTGTTDVFTLTLDRDKFLKAAGSEESVLSRGLELGIPVELTYTNREIPAETVYVPVVLPDPMSLDDAVAAAQSAVADAEQIRVIDLVNRNVTGGTIKDALQAKVNDALMRAVPLDAAAYTNLPTTIENDKDDDGNVIGWKAVLEIKEKRTDSAAKWSHTLKFAEETCLPTARQLESLIRGQMPIDEDKINAIEDNDHKLDNDYSADKLKADIMKLLEMKTLPDDLDIIVDNFKIKKATVLAKGKVTADIRVYNAKTKTESPLRSQFPTDADYNAAKINVDIKIGALGSIGTNGVNIETKVEALDYQKIIYDAMKNGSDLYDVQDALDTAIEKAANDAITNSDVSVSFAAFNLGGGDFDNPNVTAAEDNRYVGFKLPTGATDGEVAFKLVVAQTGMKDYTIDKTDGNAIPVSSDMESADGGTTHPFQNLSDVDTEIKAGTVTKLFSSYDAAGSTLAKNIDKATIPEIQREIEKMAAEALEGEFFEFEAKDVEVVAFGGSSGDAGITPGSEKGALFGTLVVADKFTRDEAKEYKFTGTVPENKKTITGVKINITRKDGNGAAKDVVVNTGASPYTATVADIGTDNSVITIKPELEGYWLAGDQGKYEIKFFTGSVGGTAITTTEADGLSANNGVLTVNPGGVSASDKTNGLTVYASVAAKLSNDQNAFPSAGDAYKTLTITCKFATPSAAALLFTDTSFNEKSLKVPYETTDGSTWTIATTNPTIQSQLAADAQTWLRKHSDAYKNYTVTTETLTLTGGTAPTTAPTGATLKFKVSNGNDAEDGITGVISLDAGDLQKSEAQTVADDAADAVQLMLASKNLEDSTTAPAAFNVTAAQAVIDNVADLAGTLEANGASDLTVTSATAANPSEVKFTVKKGGVVSKEVQITITVSGS